MNLRSTHRHYRLGIALAGALWMLLPAQAANTDIANEPLTQAATGVRPNIMFILDASGSMDWDYSPDYVDDDQPFGTTPSRTAGCFDAGDLGSGNTFDDVENAITGRADACIPGDPPYMSPDFNKQYYNPAIWYRPRVESDGSEGTSMDAASTSNWTAVPSDPYGQQQDNQLGNSATTEDLVSNYPDRAWCKATSDDPNNLANCRVNSAYTYPNWEYMRGLNNNNGFGGNFANVKYRYGSPYYYRMRTAQWCSTPTLDAGTCVSGDSVDPNVHKYIAPEFCTDPELVNCAAGAALTPAHTFSGPRWCTDKTTLLSCQRKKVGGFRWPKHLGVTKNVLLNIPVPIAASAVLNVTQSLLNQKVVDIKIGGTSIIAGEIVAGGSSTDALAVQIRDAINTHVSTPDYTAAVSGSVVTVTAVTAGAGENGKTVIVTSTQTGTVSATATITVGDSGSGDDVYLDAIQIVDPQTGALVNLMWKNCSGNYGNRVFTEAGGVNTTRIRADRGTNDGGERSSMASGIEDCIDEGDSSGSTGFTASNSGNQVTVTAPQSLGALMNGRTFSIIRGDQYGSFTATPFANGESQGVVVVTSGSLAGGFDAGSGNFDLRLGVGSFSRVDIVNSNDIYPRAPGRIDCAGATCTYAEEMTNFANWYAYYRTRMQMMKTAAGRAFVPIDDTYRVGFITIKPFADPVNSSSGSVVSARYLRIANFDSIHKPDWYAKFYGQSVGGGTPLREALSRVGRLYAGKFDGINSGIPSADDPMEVSCQPNFAILSSDGYWNGNAGDDLNGNNLGQQDHQNVGPYSLETQGVYDGGDDNTVGLADVALYYYKTDLRPAGSTNAASVNVSPDNVPTTQKDVAAHQHMTTFTLGLGLDGTLTYRSDYESANGGDFHAITQGTLSGSWPNPVADSPTALDDLWHAAVNGRGVFFSASNPQELASSLTDTLNALKQRVGAGAAAATSNLQPVAGDNFAFTAQYQTQAWIGDLKARTIDLEKGAISFVELWSAQSLLNGRQHTDREILTFDPSDTYVSTSTGAVGNQLKHFCGPLALAASETWCSDGLGLTVGELAYFDPAQLPQAGGYTVSQLPNATAENLVNFLRGSQAFEDQGLLQATDLFRERSALLGDIINAQPTYVKASPFNYSDTGYSAFKACTQGTAAAASVTCPSAQFPAGPTHPSNSGNVVRRPTVFIASNDGMLHAIETDVNNDPYYQINGIDTPETGDDTFSGGNNAGNGVERWAYMPGIVLPDLYKLGSIPYTHRYFVDGSPVASDICLSTPCAGLADWRTILVAGLNSGGRGYYALDVTDPLNPRALWEFKVRNPSVTACATTLEDAVGATDDCDLGLSFGNPVITKINILVSAGPPEVYESRWVVIVTSGLNNTGVEPATSLRRGDGMGYLYILDAASGRILHKIATGVGDPGTLASSYTDADPSGLSKINNWVDSASTDNTTRAVYGGDMKGNLWRFDLDKDSASYALDAADPTNYRKAVKVAELKDNFGIAQPVTTKPELGLISNRRVIFVATGRFLGNTDKANTAKQSVYAIADDLSGNLTMTDRAADLVPQTLAAVDTITRTISSNNTVDWTNLAVRGWYVDLPDKGERVSVDPQLQLGTLVVPSNVPSNDTCVAGGTAWINTFDFKTGRFVAGATGNAVSQKVSGSVVVGINVIQLPGGKVVTVVTTADNQQRAVETPVAPTNFQGRRVGWRELSADQ